MKTNVFVEFGGKQVDEKEIIKAAKALWTKSGNKIGDIKSMRLYVKPEDSAVYVVINDEYESIVAL